MEKLIGLLIAMLLLSINSARAEDQKNWEESLNEYITLMCDFACKEKKNPHLKACNIPTDKCKRFTTLVAKNCLGQTIASSNPIKHPEDMTHEELLSVIDKAAICTGRTIPVITYYLCPEQHENSWASTGIYKFQDSRNR